MTRAPLAALALVASSAACSVSGTVGSVYLASATLPVSGGSIAVATRGGSTLGGASLGLPPAALAAPTLIGILPGDSLIDGDWIAAGPSADWEPADLSLAAPADFLLPATVPNGVDPDDLTVLSRGPDGSERLFGDGVQFDPGSGLLHFSASHLGTFQAVVGRACQGRTGCLPGNMCVRGQCLPDDDDSDGGPPPP